VPPSADTTAFQMKASPSTKVMKKFSKANCPTTASPPIKSVVDKTMPSKHIRHPTRDIQYQSGFSASTSAYSTATKTYAYSTLTKRAVDVTPLSYSKELKKNPILVTQKLHEEFLRQIDEEKSSVFTQHIPPNTKPGRMSPICEYKYDAGSSLQLRVRLTTSGKTLDYPYQSTTRVPSNMSIDTSLSAAASGDGHLFHIDTGNFFLEHDLPEPVHTVVPLNFTPQQTKDYYHLQPLVNSKTGEKFVYMKQVKAVYGLKQSNAISEKELKVRLGS